MFIAPLITRLLNIPVLETYVVINVLIRDLVVASGIIFLSIFLLKLERFRNIFNRNNLKKFAISSGGASVMLFVYLLGMNLFDTYYDINNKWQPFTFNPFIPQRFAMFVILLIEMLFAMGVIEYICRKQVQDRLFKAKNKFTIAIWLKTSILNGIIKGGFLTILLIGLFLWYDIKNLPLLFNPSIISIYGILILTIILFAVIDFFLTLFYQHSKDFWFVNIACYTFAAWYIASWLIRV